MKRKHLTFHAVIGMVMAFAGLLFVSCEDENLTTTTTTTTTDSATVVPSGRTVWATSVPDYSIRFTMLDSNWVHCDVHNESDYMFFFSDNCDYKYEWYDGQNDVISIVLKMDSTGVLTDVGGNEIYIIDRISQDSIAMRYGGVQPDEPCQWCVDDFYLHKIQ